MNLLKRLLILLMILSMTTSCGSGNVLSDLSNKDTDEAYYIDAKKELDDMAWDSAITLITTKMSSGYQSRRDVKMTLASAYAGKCGLIFVDLIHGMTNNSATELFQFFMGVWAGKVVAPDSCELAIGVLQGIGAANVRTENENLFLALLGVARIGTNLSAKLDSGDHNGSLDGDATVCDEDQTGSLTKWSNAQIMLGFPSPPVGMNNYLKTSEVKRVAAGLGLILENFDALTSALGAGTTLTAIGDMSDSCDAALQAVAGGAATCAAMTTIASVTPEMVYAIRVMLDTSAFGFGSCSIDDTSAFIASPGLPVPATVCCRSVKPPGVP